MFILNRRYPFQQSGHWLRECVVYSVIVFLILYFLQPFGISVYKGNKFLFAVMFGAVTFLCCAVYGYTIEKSLRRWVKPWKIWHQALNVLGLVLFIGVCNFLLVSLVFRLPLSWSLFLTFLYWTLLIGIIVTVLSVGVSYHQHLRRKLEELLDKTTDAQKDLSVTIRDSRVRGVNLSLPINDLLCIEAQKNNVAVSYLKDGELEKAEIQSTLAAVLEDLCGYDNIFQCHRSFIVNVNNISSAKGNSNGYTLELGGGCVTVPVSRSYVPKLRSFIA